MNVDITAEARRLLAGIGAEMRGRFEKIRDQRYNPNVKGAGYENIVAEFLRTYMSGPYEFHTRCSLLDTQLQIFDSFSHRENEWDIAATFRIAAPRLVLELEGTAMIPYDSTAFIVSVKQTLTPDNLEQDLDRYRRLVELGPPSRVLTTGGQFTVERPVKSLFYYDGKLSDPQIKGLASRVEHWDTLVLFRSDQIVASTELPLGRSFASEEQAVFSYDRFALPVWLLFLAASLPVPLGRNNANLIHSLLRASA